MGKRDAYHHKNIKDKFFNVHYHILSFCFNCKGIVKIQNNEYMITYPPTPKFSLPFQFYINTRMGKRDTYHHKNIKDKFFNVILSIIYWDFASTVKA